MSMNLLKFASTGDVYQRLHNTVCRYKGQPVWVKAYQDIWAIELRPLGSRGSSKASVLDLSNGVPEEFDFSAPPLGYYDSGDATYYVRLTPRRQYHGGVSTSSLVMTYNGSTINASPDILNSKAMARCILGEHIPFPRALELVQTGERICAAFSRHFAVVMKGGVIYVEYKCDPVGTVSRKTGRISLFESDYASVILQELRRVGIREHLE